MCTVPGLRRICRESYSDPLVVYDTLKERGMDLVTVTDHDSIDASEVLRSKPDFFLSEEVSCLLPTQRRLHVSVFNITERQHTELQRRRDDFFALIAYIAAEDLLFCLNHPFCGISGAREQTDFDLFASLLPAVEVLNGHLGRRSNAAAGEFAKRHGKIELAGSDAHAICGLGAAFTEVPGARTREEYLTALRHGRGRARGESGGFQQLTATVLEISRELLREKSWTLLFTPLLAVVPVATSLTSLSNDLIAAYWSRRLRDRCRAGEVVVTNSDQLAA
jgi:predicted metal-dependent phosphoesterase TrpH